MDPDRASLFYSQMRSRGYGREQAWMTTAARECLIQGTSELGRLKQGPPEGGKAKLITVSAGFEDDDPNNLLLHDDLLLPAWEKFMQAMSSCATCNQGYVSLSLAHVQVGNDVARKLLQAFRTAPLKLLALTRNDLGNDGIKFVANAVGIAPTLEHLFIRHNVIGSEEDATSLVRITKGHSKLTSISLERCAIGRDDAVMSAIAPVLHSLRQVALEGNHIGSHGATLISNCLAADPPLSYLDLSDNILDDKDAAKFAKSLKKNTKIQKLDLSGNLITQEGVNTFLTAVCNSESLNGIHHSNHTCNVKFEEGLLPNWSNNFNSFANPELNKNLKLLAALFGKLSLGGSCYNNFYRTDEIDIKVMPMVLAFLQEIRTFNVPQVNELSAVFIYMREWNMPLLYKSVIDPKLRRSERIRRKKVTKLKGE